MRFCLCVRVAAWAGERTWQILCVRWPLFRLELQAIYREIFRVRKTIQVRFSVAPAAGLLLVAFVALRSAGPVCDTYSPLASPATMALPAVPCNPDSACFFCHVRRAPPLFHVRGCAQATQELLTISLDNHRNRLIQMNVTLAMLSCGVAMSTTITSMFGMNLNSGLENHPSAFFMVSEPRFSFLRLRAGFCGGYAPIDVDALQLSAAAARGAEDDASSTKTPLCVFSGRCE